MKHITARIILWFTLTAAISILLILKLKLYVCCQSLTGTKGLVNTLLPFSLAAVVAAVLVNGWENIKWHLKSWFYKKQVIK